MRFPLYIAKRYLFSKSSTNAVNIITLVSVCSIIIGTTVLFVVLSAFSGLKDFNLSMTSITDPDLKISPAQGKTLMLTTAQEKKIQNIDGIAHFSKVIEERAFLEYDGKNSIALLKGVDTYYTNITTVKDNLVIGTWPAPDEPEVALGGNLANTLSLGVGNYSSLLKIMVPRPGSGQITDPSTAFRSSSAVASGIFQISENIENELVYSNLDFVGKLLNYDVDTISSLEIKLAPEANEEIIRSQLATIFEEEISIKNRIQLNDALYKMLNTENLALYFICSLVMIIALFSFVGSLIMIILDKRKHIKTLSDLGASIKEIRQTFFLQGALMIVLGGALGVLLGALIIWLQLQFELVLITPTLPYPVKFETLNLVVVYGTILILGILAARLATSKINKKLLTTV